MNQQQEIYYFCMDNSRIIFWSEILIENRPDLIFLGSSLNPNKKMAVAVFTKNSEYNQGYQIKPLP